MKRGEPAKSNLLHNNSEAMPTLAPVPRLSPLRYLSPSFYQQKTKAFIALGMVCFFWGTTWVASKEGVKYMPALQMAGLRQFLGGLCYIAFFIIKGVKFPKGKEWVPVIVLSILNFVLSNGLSTWGVKYVSAGLASIIGAIFPLWLVVINLIITKKRLPLRAAAGIVLGFAGICFIFYEYLSDLFNPQFRFGIFISFVATVTWAMGLLYTKKQATAFNPYFNLGLQMTISGAILMGVTQATGNAVSLFQIPWQSWVAIAYLLVFSSILCFIFFIYALQNLPAEIVSLYAYITPIVAVTLGGLLFNELITPFIIVGVVITLSGVYLVNKSMNKII